MVSPGQEAECGRPTYPKSRVVTGIHCVGVTNGSTVYLGSEERHLLAVLQILQVELDFPSLQKAGAKRHPEKTPR